MATRQPYLSVQLRYPLQSPRMVDARANQSVFAHGILADCSAISVGFMKLSLTSHRRVELSYCAIETTVTDFGSSVRINLPPWTFAEIGLGITVFGASNVFTLSTFGAVSVSPAADLAVMPARLTSISTGWFGSTFVNSNHNFPFVSFAAMASTLGKV